MLFCVSLYYFWFFTIYWKNIVIKVTKVGQETEKIEKAMKKNYKLNLK